MSDALGLSIGATNLVAVRDGRPPVSRRSILTLFRGRPPEVGAPGEYPAPDQSGLVLTSFVERVGDPVPIVAPDGSSHRAELVLVEALDALARAVGGGLPITIAVPAHWPPAVVGTLRAAVRTKPGLNPNGVAPSFIPDAGAALSGLRVSPGLPPNGIVVLCDLGGTGTSITLADASAGLAIVGDTVRHSDFSGDLVDQALLNHVVTGVAQSSDADPNSTAAVGSLVRLRDECRQAKERLSAETATAVRAELPGHDAHFRVTRDELERLIDRPLSGLVEAVADTLNRYRIPPSSVSTVATIGGVAAIPLVTQRLSERYRTSVVTTPTPLLSTAVGALIVADRGLSPDTPTGMAPVADAATGMAPTTGWVPGGGGATQMAPAEGAPTSSAPQLAWSQDDAAGGDPQPYGGDDYESTYSGPTGARPAMVYTHDEADDQPDEAPPLAWYRRPPILLGAAAAALLLAAGGLAITLTSSSSDPSSPVTATATSYTTDSNGNTVPVLPPNSQSQLVTITKPNGETSTSVVPPASTTATTSSTTDSTTTTTTTTTDSSTTTTTTTSTTTTTPPPTTTAPTTTAPPPTTTAPPTTQPPTTQPPSTTQAPSTASVKPSTSAAVPAAATPTAAPATLPQVTIPVLAPQAP